jgi:hypothetical protein
MSFWDVVWFIFISFAFVAYLMVMFSIISDLFRDRDASGVAKAVWVVALIFLPFLTSLVYLIVRGRGMAEPAFRSSAVARVPSTKVVCDGPGDQRAEDVKAGIADRLFLSRHTVKAQVWSMYRKLDAHTRADAVARARELGLLES